MVSPIDWFRRLPRDAQRVALGCTLGGAVVGGVLLLLPVPGERDAVVSASPAAPDAAADDSADSLYAIDIGRPAAAPAVAVPDPEPVFIPPPPPPDPAAGYALIGTTEGGRSGGFAAIKLPDGRLVTVAPGERLDPESGSGHRLLDVRPESVVLRIDGDEVTLDANAAGAPAPYDFDGGYDSFDDFDDADGADGFGPPEGFGPGSGFDPRSTRIPAEEAPDAF